MENNNLFYVSMVAIVAIVAIFGIIQPGNYSGKTTYQAQNYAPPTSQSADSNSESENLVGQAIAGDCVGISMGLIDDIFPDSLIDNLDSYFGWFDHFYSLCMQRNGDLERGDFRVY